MSRGSYEACLSVAYVTSKSVEVSELSEGAFARVVEINVSECPFAGHFNKPVSLKLRYTDSPGLNLESK